MRLRFQKILLGLFLLTFISVELSAQKYKLRRYEAGFGFGTTQVFGDIGGTADQSNWLGLKDIRIDETKLAGELNLRYKIDPIYSVSFHSVLGFGSGDDADSRNDRGRSYKTMVTEVSVRWEYFLKPEDKTYSSNAVFNKRGMVNNYKTYSLYTFVGLGGIYYNPSLLSQGDLWKEGYDIASGYSHFGLVIPVGLGLRYVFDDEWVVGAEVGWRWTSSDFIDGYKTLSSNNRDVYYFLMLTANYRLKTSRRNIPVFLDRSFKSSSIRRRRVI